MLTIKDEIPEYQLNNEAKNEIKKKILKKQKKSQIEKKLFYEGKKDSCNFQQFDTIKLFVRNIFNNKISLDEADEDQVELSIQIMNFKKNAKPNYPEEKNQESVYS